MRIRILTLCTGNVCRSPLAAQMLTDRLDPDVFEITSAGTTALVGQEMPELAQRIADRLGLQGAKEHRAAALTVEDLTSADLILGMERIHRSYAAETVPTSVRRSFTFSEFAHIASQMDHKRLVSLLSDALEPEKAALEAVMRMRGVVPRLKRLRLYDVEDPYGRSKHVYERSGRQILQAADEIAKFFDRAAAVSQTIRSGLRP